MIEIRKENKALSQGKLVHFPVRDNVYIYFRILDDEKIMVVVNDNDEGKEVELKPILHMLADVKKFQDLKTGKEIEFNGKTVSINAKEVSIYRIID